MDKIELIKAEIERQKRRLIVLSNTEQVNMRRDCALQNGAYNSILEFINSLPEGGTESQEKVYQASEDLEKAADTYVGFPYELGEDITSTIRRNSFKDGWKQCKEQMEEIWLKDREGCFWDGVEEGKKVMKEQMMKEAVDARVVYIAHWHKNIVTDSADVEKALQNFEEGDKVKIIVIKEDKK